MVFVCVFFSLYLVNHIQVLKKWELWLICQLHSFLKDNDLNIMHILETSSLTIVMCSRWGYTYVQCEYLSCSKLSSEVGLVKNVMRPHKMCWVFFVSGWNAKLCVCVCVHFLLWVMHGLLVAPVFFLGKVFFGGGNGLPLPTF